MKRQLDPRIQEVRALALTAALETFTRYNIPTDTQALLLAGDPMRSIHPGALDAALAAALAVLFSAKFEPQRPDA